MDSLIVLIHSPLVGPLTWSVVAEHLRQRGYETLVPVLTDVDDTAVPYWQQHADAVRHSLESIPQTRSLILVGHSGAGPLLPAIQQALPHPITAYIFADAGLPHGGMSRLEEMEANVPEIARQLQQLFDAGGRYPNWSDEVLREIIPNDALRRGMLAEIHPRGRAFFTEPMPIIADWPDAPCGYLLFSPGYKMQEMRARQHGWAYREFDAGHFHMLVDAPAVTRAVIDLSEVLSSY